MNKIVLISLVVVAVSITGFLGMRFAQGISSHQTNPTGQKQIQQPLPPVAAPEVLSDGEVVKQREKRPLQTAVGANGVQALSSGMQNARAADRKPLTWDPAAEEKFTEGLDAFNAGNYQTALAKWTEAQKIDPNSADVNLALRKVRKILGYENTPVEEQK